MSLNKNSLTEREREKFSHDDKIYCKSISKSISDIIRFSLDEEFRKKCFELLGVSSTEETERIIEKRLMQLIQNETSDFTDIQRGESTLQNKNESISSRKDEENSDTRCASQSSKETIQTQSISTDNTIHAVPQNIFKRNWLQISSQQYKEILKRKKLNYYSQPQLGQQHQNDCKFFSCSGFQPSSSCSSLSLEENIPFPEALADTISYCKDKFRDSFKDNAQKYLKKNLKSHGRTSES